MKNDQPIMFALNTGASLPLRPLTSKQGHTYWGIARKDKAGNYANPGKFGVNVDPKVVGGKLPTEGTLNVAGQTVTLKGVTGVTEMAGRPKVTFSTKVTIDGIERSFSLTISQGDASYNVRGTLARAAGAKVLSSL